MSGLPSSNLEEQKQQSVHFANSADTVTKVGLKARPLRHKQQAIAEFDREFDSDSKAHPRRAEYLSSAGLLMDNEEPVLAQNLLRELLNANPNDAAAIRAMARCCAALDKNGESERLLSILITIDDRAEHLIELADCLYVQCKDAEALKYYLMALRNLSGESSYLFAVYKNIGNIFVRSHDFDSAEENYNKAYTINPLSDVLMVNFGTLEIQKGNLERAVAHFRQAVEFNPRNDRAWVGLAIVHREFGDADLSWANLEKSMDINPLNETAVQLGLSWTVKDHRWNHMIERLQTYLLRSSQDITMSLALAQLYYLAGRFAEARIEIERTLSIEPAVQGGSELLELIKKEETGRLQSVVAND